MVCMDFQKHYDRIIFIDDFLKEIVHNKLKSSLYCLILISPL